MKNILIKVSKPFVWFFIGCIMSCFIRLKKNNLDIINANKDSKIIICNHQSLLDAVILAMSLKECPYFVMAKEMAMPKPFGFNFAYIFNVITRFMLLYVKVYLVDVSSPYAVKNMIKEVKAGKSLMIFPEGRITTTGSMMKIYDGVGFIAEKTGVPIYPLYLDGLQYSLFSYTQGKLPNKLFCHVSLSAGEPFFIDKTDESLSLKEKRENHCYKINRILSELRCKYIEKKNILTSIVNASKLYGKDTIILEDHTGNTLTYDKLLVASKVMSNVLSKKITGDTVGVMLPNSIGATVTLISLITSGKVFHTINVSAVRNITSICDTLGIETILTSRLFVEKGKLEKLIELLSGKNIIYLEDIKQNISFMDKLKGKFSSIKNYAGYSINADNPAIILATSGSEGNPKGVVLSHDNVVFNCEQVKTIIDPTQKDRFFNAMPLFHSFGFTGGLLLPLLNGIYSFQYPSPLHYRVIPLLIYNKNATVCFGTDTFLRGWAKYANAYDFYSVRYMIAGAEKVKQETKDLYANKFGVRVLEGYGVTETSPVLALNTPKYSKDGSAGMILPGIKHTLRSVDGVNDGKELIVEGRNVMLGYMKDDKPRILQPSYGRYETGDIVTMDKDFVTIIGRSKRFAKIGGEMISMSSVESMVNTVWDKETNAIIAVPDDKKGEKLVLFTTKETDDFKEILFYARQNGFSELMVPKTVVFIKKIPLLGTGKINYPALKQEYFNE